MKDVKLIAKKRTLEGSRNARRLRSAGSLPVVIYGAKKEPVSVEVNTHDFEQILHHAASESVIIEIDLEGEGNVSVLVKDVQHHPVTSDLLHVDLLRIVAGQAIHVNILLELVGEPVGVKEGGLLDQVMHSIAIECLPKNLVEAIEVDVSGLEIGDTLCVSDLDLGDKLTALVDSDAIVVSVATPRAEEDSEEEVSEGDASAEPEVISEKKADDEAAE